MSPELEQQLYDKYPLLFVQKDWSMRDTAMCWGICFGDGWYNILESLCKILYAKRYNAKYWVDTYIELNNPKNDEKLIRYLNELDDAEANMPQFVQIKEKFGYGRFYLNNLDKVGRAAVDFAEYMTMVTCELCGAPGEIGGINWYTCRCDNCRKETK